MRVKALSKVNKMKGQSADESDEAPRNTLLIAELSQLEETIDKYYFV